MTATLTDHVERVLALLDGAQRGNGEPPPPTGAGPVEHVAAALGLDDRERDVLVLLAAIELDCTVGLRFGDGDGRGATPTVGALLAALPGTALTAFAPSAPLRRWDLVKLGGGPTLATRQVTLPERVLFALLGEADVDERVDRIARPLPMPEPDRLPPATLDAARRALDSIRAVDEKAGAFHLEIIDADPMATEAVAALVADDVGCVAWEITAAELPVHAAELGDVVRLIERETALGRAIFTVAADPCDAIADRALARLRQRAACPLILLGDHRRQPGHRPTITIELVRPTWRERHAHWRAALGATVADVVDAELVAIAHQFDLDPAEIEAAAAEAAGGDPVGDDPGSIAARAWSAARTRARLAADDLVSRADRTSVGVTLVLPEEQRAALDDIAVHARNRRVVESEWKVAGGRPRPVAALFSGPSGTGKTLAAELLADDLQLDLVRVDLSATVSKYIGDTEKNLRRVFDVAERSGAVLLFDEADALFGKRSEVRDAHDRHANIEVSYLLQRLETARGVVILTTNLAEHVDDAFLRRISHVVEFPFPDAAARREIWAGVFPPTVPTDDVDLDLLAQLGVAGGNIVNIAVNAAAAAAARGEPVSMPLLAAATRREFQKLGRSPSATDFQGWPT